VAVGAASATLIFGTVVLLAFGSPSSGTGAPPARSAVAARHIPSSGPSTASPAGELRPSAASGTTPPTNVYANIRPGDMSPAVAHDPERVYIPNGRPGTLEVIDPKRYRVIRTMQVGAMPQHVTPSWNLKWLYVDVSHSSDLAVIDPRTARVVRTIHGVDFPYNLYFTPDGTRAIVVTEYEDRLNFMNPTTWKPIASLPLPCNGPDHMDFSADGSSLLISCEYDGDVVRVNPEAMKVTGTIHVGGLPVDVKLSPDGSVFFVANQGRGGVSVIDPVALREIAFLPTGAGAHGMAVARDTRHLYVSNRLAGTISVIDFATRKVVHTWDVGGSPDMLQVSPNGRQLWFSNRFGTTVGVMDTRTGRVIHRIEVGADPHGLAYFPQPGRISLGHNGVYR
jgi:YVTN family beta-propeller protein